MAERVRFLARKSDGRFYQGFDGLGQPQLITRKTVEVFLKTNQCFDAKTGRSLSGASSGDSISIFDESTADTDLWNAIFLANGMGPK
jgi:hypothetical protein